MIGDDFIQESDDDLLRHILGELADVLGVCARLLERTIDAIKEKAE